MEPPFRILHLEDDPVDARLVVRLLREGGLKVDIDRIHTFAAFQQFLEHRPLALILADYTVPGVDVLKALQLARQVRPEVPFVLLSGTLGEDTAIETLKMGATDYVLKQRMARLVPAVRRALQESAEQLRRKQAEAAREEAYSLLRAVTEGVAEAIFAKDERGRYLMINTAGARRLGKTRPAEVLHKEDRDFFPPEVAAAVRAHDREVMARGKLQIFEETRVVSDVPRVFLTSKTPYRDHDGKIVGVLGIAHDITERKEAEEAICQLNESLERRVEQRTRELKEANASLQSFAHMAAHDFRTPVRAISSCAAIALAKYGPNLDARGRTTLEHIKESADQINQLLNDLLDFCRMSQAELSLQPVSLQSAVAQVLSLLEAEVCAKKAVVTVQDPMPAVLGHPATLVLLLNNLLSNALKFVPPQLQPQIRIRAEIRPAPATVVPRTDCVRLFVEDNGIGIASEDLEKLFGVFQRLHGKEAYPGTGLGLAIVKKAAERMGGTVGVESEPGKGSCFWIHLPKA